jgi:hypothetical protein
MSLCICASPLVASEFPEATITNGLVTAKLYLPDARDGYYRATRFDWSGVIADLSYGAHHYFGVWFPRYDPHLHDSISGPVEEFRTGESAPGFDEAPVGGRFIRIGVGVLRKDADEKFQQFKTYDIVDPGKWTVKTTPTSVEFTQALTEMTSGFGYLYTKRVHLAEGKPQLIIDHTLKNTGRRELATNVYSHNFWVIDQQPSGPDFSVRFPFAPTATLDLKGLATVHANELTYLKTLPAGQSVYTELTGFGPTPKDFDIRVENRKTGAGVRLTGDRPLSRIVFWSIRTVLSPEPYIEMKVAPQREVTWRLTYDFYELPASSQTVSR